MLTVAYKRPRGEAPPRVSFVLLDWSCRESFHSLDYLAQQSVPRDSYEIIWIEYYDRHSPELDKKIIDAAAKQQPAPLDFWAILGMERKLYYHKHLMYNVGIAYSRGDIVIICDSDAMFPPNFVETVIATFDADPAIVLHFDQVRNSRQDLYPFSYPSFEEMIGPGVINWRDGKTSGLWDQEDPLHTRNYGAAFCAKRADLLAIGGADQHLDYLGHVCGPYELTFRLVNKGLKEVWHDSVFLYHTWHPGSDGEFNYIGPSDGRNMSSTALAARENGRVMPLLENPAIHALRTGGNVDDAPLIDPAYHEAWTEEEISKSPHFTLFQHVKPGPRLAMAFNGHNIVEYEKQFFGVAHELGQLDLSKPEDRSLPSILVGDSVETVQAMIEALPMPAADLFALPSEDANAPPPVLEAAIAAAEPLALETVARQAAAMPGRNADSGLVSELANELIRFAGQGEIERRTRNDRLKRIEDQIRERGETAEQLRLMIERKDQIIAALRERIAGLEREAAVWRPVVSRFPATLNLLPLLSRGANASDSGPTVVTSAVGELGHFLYGPYLHMEDASYRLDVTCEAKSANGDDGNPALAIEVAAGAQTIVTQYFSRSELNQPLTVDFTVSKDISQSPEKVEFRFAKLKPLELRVTKVTLCARNVLLLPPPSAEPDAPPTWGQRLFGPLLWRGKSGQH
jgi:hypothetical protein